MSWLSHFKESENWDHDRPHKSQPTDNTAAIMYRDQFQAWQHMAAQSLTMHPGGL